MSLPGSVLLTSRNSQKYFYQCIRVVYTFGHIPYIFSMQSIAINDILRIAFSARLQLHSAGPFIEVDAIRSRK